MNLLNAPEESQLRQLLAACDDAAHAHVLWVDQAGEVFLDPIGPSQRLAAFDDDPRVRFRLETFGAGGDYAGTRAANDHRYVAELFNALVTYWGEGRQGWIEYD